MEELTRQLEQRRLEIARNQRNKAGQGASFALFETAGQGPFEFQEQVDFVLAFQEEPFLAYGSNVDSDDLRTLLNLDDSEVPPFPLTSGFVTNWVMDSHDFYVGAFVGVRVHFPFDLPVPTNVQVVVRHYFKFEAIGLKAILS